MVFAPIVYVHKNTAICFETPIYGPPIEVIIYTWLFQNYIMQMLGKEVKKVPHKKKTYLDTRT